MRRKGYNYNPWFCYPRRMVNFRRNDMLFSSSDSSNLQRAFRGMGSMRKRRVAVIEVVLTCSLQQMIHWICQVSLVLRSSRSCYPNCITLTMHYLRPIRSPW